MQDPYATYISMLLGDINTEVNKVKIKHGLKFPN
jgi:hypothetical protein